MHARASRPRTLTTLEAGRGLAALLVVLFHATGLFASTSYWSATILSGFFRFGHAGVEFFFALSGFIMVLVHRRDVGHPSRLGNFLEKRAIRIFPIYWTITLIVFALYVATGNSRARLLSNSALLVGSDTEAILAVAWTLFHEILFYCLFSILILNRKIGLVALGIWFAICALWLSNPAPHYSLSSINIVFGFGMLAAVAYGRVPYPRAVLAGSMMAFIALGCEADYVNVFNEQVRALLFGAIAAIGIAAAACAEAKGQIVAPSWMTALGAASYSLYLVHYPVLALAGRIWLASPLRALPSGLAFGALVIAAVAVGYAAHRLIELPLAGRLGRRRAEVRRPSSA